MQEAQEKSLLEQLMRKFISASHILHYHGVLDAYGHLSFRHPYNPTRFFMSRSIAPCTISGPEDLIEYLVENAEPVDPNSVKGYAERCIHSECYKRFPGVNAVIHNHSEAVVPYSITGIPLRACYHMAGFLKSGAPIWDIDTAYKPSDIKDMLVRNIHLGESLAAKFADDAPGDVPKHAVVLMRGHGLTIVADNIEECVLKAVYTQKNALIQTTALTTIGASGGPAQQIKYLNEEEATASTGMTKWSIQRPWKLWVREIESAGLYINQG
jgi:ribulose-5-phosphate 4-epimerase/fuculose-1-phosphate aldolase